MSNSFRTATAYCFAPALHPHFVLPMILLLLGGGVSGSVHYGRVRGSTSNYLYVPPLQQDVSGEAPNFSFLVHSNDGGRFCVDNDMLMFVFTFSTNRKLSIRCASIRHRCWAYQGIHSRVPPPRVHSKTRDKPKMTSCDHLVSTK